MGRNRKSVNKINEAYCLDFTLLLKQGYLIKGQSTSKQTITWYRQGQIVQQAAIGSTYSPYLDKQYINLSFCIVETDGNIVVQTQTIELAEIESNLGKGKITYLKYPVTGNRCRKLYRLDDTSIWQCREAFKDRLYYPLQLCSRLQSYGCKCKCYSYWTEKYVQQRVSYRYLGKRTKWFERYSDLLGKANKMAF